MRGFLRTLVFAILVFAAGLAIWKLFGGNPGNFFSVLWHFFYAVVNGLANVFVEAYKTIVGSK